MKWAGVVYLVLLHAATAIALIKTDLVARTAVRLGISAAPEAPMIVRMRIAHRQIDPQVPAGAVLFFGDSITMALATAAVAPGSVNFGIDGQRSDHLLSAMPSYKSISRAGAVVLAIGVNDLRQGQQAGLDVRYNAILASIPTSVPVVVSSITPIVGMDSAAMDAARTHAKNACAQRARCQFVDALQLLAPSGVPLPDALQPDGVHLGARGYAVWAAALKNALTHDSSPSSTIPARIALAMISRPALLGWMPSPVS